MYGPESVFRVERTASAGDIALQLAGCGGISVQWLLIFGINL